MRMVLVQWKDATMEGGWHDKEYAQTITGAEAVTLGFLIAENEQWLKLAQSTSENEDGNLTEIPKVWVTAIETLKVDDGSA
jgi:hypothetical protein